MSSSKQHTATVAGWACALVLVACVVAMKPYAEIGLHDDWSYIYTAKRLFETGRVIYNGWATAMLGWQLYLAALFFRIFGVSFSAARASNVLVAALCAPLLQSVFVRLGAATRDATLATLTFVLSPLFLPLAASYMSDIPSVFCILVCLYCCVRSAQAAKDRTAVVWIAAAALSNIAGGTVRQIAWLGVLVMVPSVGWSLRKRRGVLRTAVASWLIACVCIAIMMLWFKHQPFTSQEKFFALDLTAASLKLRATMLVKSALTLAVLSLPILAGVTLRTPLQTSRQKTLRITLIAMPIAAVLGATLLHPGIRWMTLLAGDYVSPKGILDLPWLLGATQDVVPSWAQACFAMVALTVTATTMQSVVLLLRKSNWNKATWQRSQIFWLLAPFTAAYCLLIVTRVAIFDRYLLPLVLVCLLLLLHVHASRCGGSLPWSCLLLIAVGAVFGVAGSHDMFASARARLQAAETLRARGVPRTALRAGFEYDGWTEIERTGYVNEPRIHLPANAYRPWVAPSGLKGDCQFWFQNYTPNIHARYELSNQPGVCFPDAGIPPVVYRTWLPPYQHSIYFVEVPPALR